MNKIKIAALAAGVLLLAGCGNKAARPATDSGADNAGATKTEEKGMLSEAITSIKDAMASGKAMKCSYTIKNKEGGDIVSTMYVDGKKYAGTTNVAGIVQHMIFDETAMYSWSEGQKTGMKMTTACSEELAAKAPKSQNDNAPTPPTTDPEKTFDNALDVKCEPNSGGDFTIPSDITFTDQCEMMKNLQKNLPSGTNIPNMPKGMPTNIPTDMTPPQL